MKRAVFRRQTKRRKTVHNEWSICSISTQLELASVQKHCFFGHCVELRTVQPKQDSYVMQLQAAHAYVQSKQWHGKRLKGGKGDTYA